jgi:hypothetical protein
MGTTSDWAMQAANPQMARIAFLRRNGLALLSMFVALSGLGYNTWRNETTEAHRNVRQAAFVVLEQLGELQQVSDQRYFAGVHDDAQRIVGWGKVTLLRDLGALVSPATEQATNRLASTWRDQLDALDAGDMAAEDAITADIVAARMQVVRDLERLR